MSNISQFFRTFIATLSAVATSGAYNDLTGKPTLGTAAALDVGTTANKIVQLDGSGKYPGVSGENITNIVSTGAAPTTPYTVLSAVTDVNGRADFMDSTMTQIDFDVTIPIKICYPSGGVESNVTMASITSGFANGTNFIIKELGGGPYVTLLQPVESDIAPVAPATNQLWLDTSVVPRSPKKWNGSAWVVTQYVKLGEVEFIALVVGTPISYALNGFYNTGIFSVSANTSYDKVSNIGTTNVILEGFLRRNSSEPWVALQITQDASSVILYGASMGVKDRLTIGTRIRANVVTDSFYGVTAVSTTGEIYMTAKARY